MTLSAVRPPTRPEAAALAVASPPALDVGGARRRVPVLQLAVSAVVLVCVAQVVLLVVTNDALEWDVFAQWVLAPDVLRGLGVTLALTAVAMTLGILLGLLIAVMRLSSNPVASGFARLFNWLVRGTPLLVQLIFLYNMAVVFPRISLAIPFGPTFHSWDTNALISPLTAAIMGLTLNEAAYMSEIIRGGLLSVDRRQAETAYAFGMTRTRTLWRIVLPQAMRAIVPPTGNQLISMVKGTSLVSVIAMGELLYSVQTVYNQSFQVIPLLMVAVAWYLVVTSVLSVAQSLIERYYARGDRAVAAAGADSTAEHA